MKKTMMTLASLVLVCGTIIAQDSKVAPSSATPTSTSARPRSAEGMENRQKGGPSAEVRAKQATEELNTKVSLTKEQYEKVYAIKLAEVKQRMELKSTAAVKEEMSDADRAKMQEARKANQEKIKALLTPDQLEKLKVANKAKKAENNAKFKPATAQPAAK